MDTFMALLLLESGYSGGKLVVINSTKQIIFQEQIKGPLGSVLEKAAKKSEEMHIEKTYINNPPFITKMIEITLETKGLTNKFILA